MHIYPRYNCFINKGGCAMKSKRSPIVKTFSILVCIGICMVLILLGINCYVVFSADDNIITEEQASQLSDVDCILVLGAGVRENGPSPLLQDRIDAGVSLYFAGASPKMIMSGDHGRIDYDEVNVMKDVAIEAGVPSEDIFMDHAGFSTYESLYRAKEIFGADKIVIVTQKYHLFRALYIADQLGIEAYGVASDPRRYTGAVYREAREVLARNKDFVMCFFKPEPTYLGEAIPVSGDGNITNDK